MTPWTIYGRLVETIGEDQARRVFVLLDEMLAGQLLYWPKAVRRKLRDEMILALRSQGFSTRSIALKAGTKKRTVERVIKAHLEKKPKAA